MKPSIRLEKLLNKRLQFLQSLFLISSYHELIKANTTQLRQKHYDMEKQEMETISNILRTVRIDETFKKQFHRTVLKPGLNTGKEASGTHKQIMADYTTFFAQLKEKHILDFLSQIFQLQIYSQTTVIYVLVQLLLKYLRIKCVAFISDKIQPKVPINNHNLKFNHFSNFMTRQNSKQQKNQKHQNNIKSNHRKRNVSSPLSQQYRRQSTSIQKQSIASQTIRINCKTIGTLSPGLTGRNHKRPQYSRKQIRSANIRKNSICISNDGDPKPKRRIIKSFKDVRQDTKQKIQRNIQNIAKASRQWGYTTSQAYHKVFNQVFKEEWNQYFQLIGIQDIQGNNSNQNSLKIPQSGYSSKRKSEWFLRNNDRVVVEACSRNDEIRKSMETYTECHNDNHKG